MSNFTSIPGRHLNAHHTLFDPKKHVAEKPSDQTDIRERFKKAKITGKELLLLQPFHNSFRALLLEWIIRMNVAFTTVENQHFRKLLRLLIDQADELLPRTGNTVRTWVLQEFENYKKEIKVHILTHTRNRIHFSFDL